MSRAILSTEPATLQLYRSSCTDLTRLRSLATKDACICVSTLSLGAQRRGRTKVELKSPDMDTSLLANSLGCTTKLNHLIDLKSMSLLQAQLFLLMTVKPSATARATACSAH